MSRGVYIPKVVNGISEGALTAQWSDGAERRAAARAKAAREHDQHRRSVLQAATHKSRSEALAMGRPRYVGHVCKRGHNGERYTNDGNCVECVRLAAERRRRLRGLQVKGARPNGQHPLRSARRAAARAERAGETRTSRTRTSGRLTIAKTKSSTGILLKRN